jgi:hypothetical protein
MLARSTGMSRFALVLAGVLTTLSIGGCGPDAGRTAGPAVTAAAIPPTLAATDAPAASPPEPAPSQTVSAVASPTVVPAVTGAAGLAGIQQGTVVRVIVAELNVRDGPATSSAVVRVVQRGAMFQLGTSAPMRADGYLWSWAREIVLVDRNLPALPSPVELVSADYIALGTEARAFVEPVAARCPQAVDLANVAAMLPGERLACFGQRSLTLEGTFQLCGCDGDIGPVVYEPEWLATDGGLYLSAWPDQWTRLLFKLPPPLEEPAEGSLLRIVGHLDDPRAQTCRGADLADPDNPIPFDASEMILGCRHRFVVETIDVLGLNPDWPNAG